MSDHTALWIIFALLLVAFVLVVVTARRGPWERPGTTLDSPRVSDPYVPDPTDPIDFLAVIIREAKADPYSVHITVPSSITITNVDPLWGKHPPESWS